MRNTITSSIRQGIRNAIQSVLGSLQPLFDLPVMKTLVPTTGTTPTFTRDTTKTGTNYDGQVFAGLANEPIFEGARRVENLITASEDMTNAAYSADPAITVDSATEATWDGTDNNYIFQNVTITDDGSGAGGRTFVYSVWVKLVSGTIAADANCQIKLVGDAVTDATQSIGSSVTTTSQRFTVTASTDAAGTTVRPQIKCDDAATLEITNWQLEETTANSDTSIPSEYVSTGVGTGSELVIAQAAAQWVPGGSNTIADVSTDEVLITYVDSASGGQLFFDTDEGVTAADVATGKDFVVTFEAKSTGTVSLRVDGGTEVEDQVISSSTYTAFTYVVNVDNNAGFFLQPFNMTTGEDVSIRNVSVKEASHGANVDGVEYFLQTNPNTVNSGVVTSDTNKAMTFTEKRTGPIALSTALAVDDGFNASTSLYGAVASFPNLLPPAARVDFTEWTQTGTGSITPVGDGVEIWDGVADVLDSGWTDNGDGTFTCDGTDNVGAKFNLDDGAIAQNKVYAGSITISEYNSGTVQVYIYDGNGMTDVTSGFSSAGTHEFSLSLDGTSAVSDCRINVYSVTSFDGTVSDVSLQERSYTTLSDEDDTASECRWALDVTIPNDDETYQVPITLSEGTAAATDLEIRFSGTSTDINRVTHTWATGISTVDANQSGNTTINTAANSDGTVTLTMGMTDIAANTTISIRLFPATNDTSLQGTVNVHGDVGLNRVSVAAEPTWNTLRPGDSVEQLLLQQQDFNTTWLTGGVPILTQNETDIFGNVNTAWTIEDNQGAAYGYVYQGMSVGAEGKSLCGSVFIRKESSMTGAPALRMIGDATYDVLIDPVNGKVLYRTGGTAPDRFGIIDGAILKPFFPAMVNVDNFWLVWLSVDGDTDTTPSIDIYPAINTSYVNGASSAATGTYIFDMPTLHEGKTPFFFDSIATTAPVTEVIQDWSKIFSYSTEADDNVANIVFDHNYLEGAGVNIEGASSNIITASQDISASPSGYYLTGANITITPGFTDPAGTSTAVRLTATSSGIAADNYIRRFSAANTYTKGTFSVWVRRITGTGVISLQGPNGVYGAKDVESEISGAWTRVDVSTTSGGGYLYFGIGVETSGDVIEVAFFQVEPETDFPSSYIPTDGSSVTRNADLLTYSAVGVADTFPMTLSADVIPSQNVGTSDIFLGVDNGVVVPRVQLRATSGVPRLLVSPDGGGNTVLIDATSPMVAGTTTAIAGAVSTTSSQLYVDGSPDGPEDTSATLPTTLSTIRIASRHDTGGTPYANVRNVKIFDKRLTDAEVSKL